VGKANIQKHDSKTFPNPKKALILREGRYLIIIGKIEYKIKQNQII